MTAIYGVVGLLVFLTYRPPKPQLARQNSMKDLLLHADFVGSFLFAGSVASLVYGLNYGGAAYAWTDGPVLAPLICGCIGFVLLGLYERFIKRDGLFDNRLFQSFTFPVLLLVCAIDVRVRLAAQNSL